MPITKPPVLPVWADTGDKVQPSDAELSAGWPLSNIPPARQRFNWFFNFCANAVRYFSRRGIPDWDAAETYKTNDRSMGPDGLTYVSLVDNNINFTPATNPSKWERWGHTKTQLDSAINSAVSAVGGYFQDVGSTANAYVISPTPPLTGGYVSGQTFRVRTLRTNTGASTLDAGLGAKAILREDGNPVQSGDIYGIITVTYDSTVGGGAWLYNGEAVSQLGALATKGFGQGLEDDGAGGARVKLADASLARSASGVRTNKPVSYISGAVTLATTHNDYRLVATAAATITAPRISTTFANGLSVVINADQADVSFIANANDKIDNGALGGTYIIPQGTSAEFTADGVNQWVVQSQTAIPGASPAPQYINANRSLVAGQYLVDTSSGIVTLTLPASPAQGTSIRVIDAFNTFWNNNAIMVPSGGDKINNLTGNFLLDVYGGVDVYFIYKSGNWSIQ